MKKYYCITHKQVYDDRYQCIECRTDENNIGNYIEITDGEGAIIRKLDRILALTEDASKKYWQMCIECGEPVDPTLNSARNCHSYCRLEL